MSFKVNVYLDNKLIKPSEVANLEIKNITVDKIINNLITESQVGAN